jgi:hypothetical protein
MIRDTGVEHVIMETKEDTTKNTKSSPQVD